MNEGYHKGSKCIECGRTVELRPCCVCDGTGKAKLDWKAYGVNDCPRCEGKGFVIKCPIADCVTLYDSLHGITCKSYDDNGKYIGHKQCKNL